MAAVWRALGGLLRVLCYLSLAAMLSALLALAVSAGLCTDVSSGVPRCGGLVGELGRWGFAVMLVASISGVPVLLALAGAVLVAVRLVERAGRPARHESRGAGKAPPRR